MARYRKKPVVIEARKVVIEEFFAIAEWCGGQCRTSGSIIIPTLEGEMRAVMGDYIIKGIKGEFYPCQPDIFDATYDPVEDHG